MKNTAEDTVHRIESDARAFWPKVQARCGVWVHIDEDTLNRDLPVTCPDCLRAETNEIREINRLSLRGERS